MAIAGGSMTRGPRVLLRQIREAMADGGPAQLPRPTIEGGTGLNLQNLFYALQWWVFGGFAVLLWVRLVRDEAAGGKRRARGEDAGIAGLPGPADADATGPRTTP